MTDYCIEPNCDKRGSFNKKGEKGVYIVKNIKNQIWLMLQLKDV